MRLFLSLIRSIRQFVVLFPNRRQQLRLLQTALEMMLTIQDGMRRAQDPVMLSQVGEGDGGNSFDFDEEGLEGELVGQADRLGAVGSGGGGENFQVDRALHSSKGSPSFAG